MTPMLQAGAFRNDATSRANKEVRKERGDWHSMSKTFVLFQKKDTPLQRDLQIG